MTDIEMETEVDPDDEPKPSHASELTEPASFQGNLL